MIKTCLEAGRRCCVHMTVYVSLSFGWSVCDIAWLVGFDSRVRCTPCMLLFTPLCLPSINLSICLSVHPFICPSVCAYIHLFTHPSIHPSIHLSIHLPVLLNSPTFIRLSVHLSICLLGDECFSPPWGNHSGSPLSRLTALHLTL